MKINKEEGRSNNKYREIVSECFSSTEKKEEIKIISLDAWIRTWVVEILRRGFHHHPKDSFGDLICNIQLLVNAG